MAREHSYTALTDQDYSDDEREFLRAVEHYKKVNRRPFPAWSEVLTVLLALGYRRVAEPSDMPTMAQVIEARLGRAGYSGKPHPEHDDGPRHQHVERRHVDRLRQRFARDE